METFLDLLNIFIPLLLIALGFFAGRLAESAHYRSIKNREAKFLSIPALTVKTLDDPRPVQKAELVVGSVVVSVDYFKRVLMMFRRIFGGEVRSYSPLIDRGRREALLRMKEMTPDADLFLNCRLETSTISSGQGKATGSVEIVAYGTAIAFQK